MSEWQRIIREESIATLEKLADKFGHDVIDVEALKPAFDNFQMRLTPAALDAIKEVGDPMWQQYIPTVEELDVVDGVIDSLDEDGDSPVPNITHRYPDRALFLVSPVCATYCRFCTRRRKVGESIHAACQGLREPAEDREGREGDDQRGQSQFSDQRRVQSAASRTDDEGAGRSRPNREMRIAPQFAEESRTEPEQRTG